jgi:hypothetical protein
MHEMHDDEEFNIIAREAIAKRDFDVNDEGYDDEVVTKEEIDDDDEEDVDEEVVDDDGDEGGHHEVDSDGDNHEVDSDGDNHEHKQNDVNDDESVADTCAVLTVGCEDEYPTFVATDPLSVDFDSGSVWKDGRRRSARLLAKKGGGSTPKPLLGSTLDHLGRRRSLRLQQQK